MNSAVREAARSCCQPPVSCLDSPPYSFCSEPLRRLPASSLHAMQGHSALSPASLSLLWDCISSVFSASDFYTAKPGLRSRRNSRDISVATSWDWHSHLAGRLASGRFWRLSLQWPERKIPWPKVQDCWRFIRSGLASLSLPPLCSRVRLSPGCPNSSATCKLWSGSWADCWWSPVFCF